jgi:excisionase family DNA binding protein
VKSGAHFEDMADVLTVEEAGRLLRIGRNAVYEGIHRGEIPHFKIGRSIRVPKAGLMRMLSSSFQEEKAAGAPTSATRGGGRYARPTPT